MISKERAEEFARIVCQLGFDAACIHYGISPESGRRYVRRSRQAVETAPIKPRLCGVKPEVIGIIGDTHEPFCHKDYLGFVSKQFEKHGVTKVVHIGDLGDHHAISRHVSEPNAMGAEKEYELTLKGIEKWTTRFPEAILCKGNHDAIPVRQAKELGIPEVFMKDLHQLWKLPDTWQVVEDITINDVYYKHGVGTSGIYGAATLAKNMAMSSVMGHIHSAGFCHYMSNPQQLWFGLACGCGIDIKAYAFRYSKPFTRRPVLGCGIVKSSEEAYFIPMHI